MQKRDGEMADFTDEDGRAVTKDTENAEQTDE